MEFPHVRSLTKYSVPQLEDSFPWRLNLVEITDAFLYLAVNDKILQTDLWTGRLLQKMEFAHIKPPETNYCINCIKIGAIGLDDVLVAVNEAGEVMVKFLNAQRDPVIFDNIISTWGIAISATRRLIAVSSNERLIRVYDMVNMNSRILTGHQHNIPGIDFSPNGQFLVSCSIDGSCKIWNVDTGDMIADEILSDQWQWTAQFIRKEDLQLISDLSEFSNGGILCSVNQEFMDLDSCSDKSSESWHTGKVSTESSYYECIEDSKYISNQLILSTSTNHIFLSEQYGKKLKVLARLDNISQRQHVHFDLDRLSIVKWIKELSIAIVASQIGLLGILRIVKWIDSQGLTKYMMRIEKWMNIDEFPLLGVSYYPLFDQEDPSLNHVLLGITNYDQKFQLYSLSLPSILFSNEKCHL